MSENIAHLISINQITAYLEGVTNPKNTFWNHRHHVPRMVLRWTQKCRGLTAQKSPPLALALPLFGTTYHPNMSNIEEARYVSPMKTRQGKLVGLLAVKHGRIQNFPRRQLVFPTWMPSAAFGEFPSLFSSLSPYHWTLCISSLYQLVWLRRLFLSLTCSW